MGSSTKLDLLSAIFGRVVVFGSWESRSEDIDGTLLLLEVLAAGVRDSISASSKLTIRNLDKHIEILISYLESLR